MDKKLPGVFANKINKALYNNKTVFYGGKEEIRTEKQEKKETKISFSDSLNIKQKINQVFHSEYYVYKINVELTLKDKKVTKKLIGYNDRDVITIDNELIPISEIQDIEIKLEN